MDAITSISSVFEFAIKNGIGIGAFICVLGMLVWRRTRSAHMLLVRLWWLFAGRNECTVPALATFFGRQAALMGFRFITNVQARTVENAEAIVAWQVKHNEDMSAIAACGELFDQELPGLKPLNLWPARWQLGLAALLLFSAFGAGLFAAAGTVTPRALLEMKASGIWFTIDDVSARRFSFFDSKPGFLLSACSDKRAPLVEKSGFTGADVDLICNAVHDPGTPAYLHAALQSQRIIFAPSAVLA